MANIIRIKRKALGAGSTAPATLINAELAFNEDSKTLYYGLGTSGSNNEATNIVPIGGQGAFVSLGNLDQTIDGTKTFTNVKSPTISATNITVDNLTINSTTNIPNLNADLLDGQDGSYYLDWNNATNKPSPVITLSGDVSGSATLTSLGSATINATITPNSVDLVTDTTGNYVDRIINSSNITGGVASHSGSATLDLTSTGVASGNYGSSTSIPTFTVDTYGRLTAAGSASLATNLNISGNSGTDTVNLLTDTLTVSGGTHVTSTVTDNNITLTVDATNDNTVSTIVARDGSGNFSAGTITANLTGLASSASDSDLLDGQHGSYYLNWNNSTNKPSPVITLSGDVSGSATLTSLGSATITATITPNSVDLGADTTGNYVKSIINSSNITGGVDSESADATLDLTTTGVNSGTYGSQTQIPIITVDNKGRITSASTTAIATGLNISGNSGTDTVNLLTDTLTVSGGTHVTSTVTDNKITLIVDATSSNTNSTIISRDDTGGFETTTVTASNLKSTSNLNISANGSNSNIYLTPSGSGFVDVASKRITNVATPTQSTDAANKNYVDLLVQGLDPKQSVRLATTPASGNIASLSGTSMTIDGIAVVDGDRVLIKDQSTASQNGIYIVSSGIWSRATDMDDWTEVPSAYVFVETGLTNADNGFLCTSDQGGTINNSDIIWVQFNGAGQVIAGAGLTKTGNTLDVIGTTGRITVNANSVDIASDYIGQNTITNLGTVSAGTWQADTVAVGYGGTGQTSFTSKGIIYGNGINSLQVTPVGTWDTPNSIGQILSVNSVGTPTWTNTIDGGSY